MSEPILSDQARVDLDEAWDYLAERNIEAADRLLERFAHAARMHARFPESGRLREGIGPGLRSFLVAPYVVFFRQVGETIEVLRILHGRRDLDRIMREDESS